MSFFLSMPAYVFDPPKKLDDITLADPNGLYGKPSLYVPGEEGASLVAYEGSVQGLKPYISEITTYFVYYDPDYPEDGGYWVTSEVITGKIELDTGFELILPYSATIGQGNYAQIQDLISGLTTFVYYDPEFPEDGGYWQTTALSSLDLQGNDQVWSLLDGIKSQDINNNPTINLYTGPKLQISQLGLGQVQFTGYVYMGTLPVEGEISEVIINATLSSKVTVNVPAEYFSLWDVTPAPSRPAGNQLIKPSVFERLIASGSDIFFNALQSNYSFVPFFEYKNGAFAKMFAEEDFYDRIQYQFISLNLGTVLSPKEKTLWVWNAFRRERVLEDILQTGFDGIFFSGDSTPDKYKALQQKTYNVTVTIDGPEFINAVANFDWDEGLSQEVLFAGRRAVVWSWRPDWSRPVLERLEWNTDIITAYKGQEQRRAIRRAPRRYAEFYTGATEENDRQIMETAIFGWGAKNWAVPLWWDGRELSQEIQSGDMTVYVDTLYADFQPGEAAVIYVDSLNYEAVDIVSVESDRINILLPTTDSWPAGCLVLPVRGGKLDGTVDLERWDGRASFERVRFIFEKPANYEADSAYPLHNGYPVFETSPNWIEAPQISYERKALIFDPSIGLRSFEDESGVPAMTQKHKYTFFTKEESHSWRKYLYKMRGAQGAMYIPTWASDLELVATIEANALAIDVKQTNRTLLVGQAAGRRDIRVKLKTGQIFYRAITGSSELNSSTERFNITQSFGIQINPENIELISYMVLGRFDSDAFEFSWWSGDVCDVATSTRSFNNAI